VDKGWIASIDGFAAAIASGAAPVNATPLDALKAHLIAVAAVKSRETREVVKLSR